MIEFDEIYEISTVAGDNWWIPKEEYYRIIQMVNDDVVRDECRFIEFKALSGSIQTVRVGAINLIQYSTEEQREAAKQINEEYKSQHQDFK